MPLSKELLNERRSHRKWYSYRKRHSTYSRWADILFDRDTKHEQRAMHAEDNVSEKGKIPRWAKGELTEEKREQIRQRLRDRMRRARESPRYRVVFFGDGSFSSSLRGSAPIPKKEFLRLLGPRGPTVLLDEFRTSKMCPCGQDTLKNANCLPGCRLRCHTAIATDCPLGSIGCQGQDRDVLATLNMLHCAQNALKGQMRPSFLCR